MRFFLFVLVIFGASSVQATIEYTLEHNAVCDPIAKKRTVKMGNRERSALHLTEGRLFKSWTGSRSFNCTFQLQGISRDELSVVVQHLNLRQDPLTGDCIDYIQFQREDTGSFNGKMCGEMKSSTTTGLADDQLLESALLHFKDDLIVNIFIAKIPLEPGQKIKLDLVFTSFKMCSENAPDYAACGDTKMCIWGGLFFDGNINCPYNGCYDEKFCYDSEPKKTSYHINSELNIMFIFFTTCVLVVLIVCAYFKCQAYFLDESIPTELRCATPVCATAPPLDDPKDAPPPYHSLFPDCVDQQDQGPEATPLVQPPSVVVDLAARIDGSPSATF